MPLKLIRPKHIDLDVRVAPPEAEPSVIKIRMKYLDVKERQEYLERAAQENARDEQMLEELVIDWQGVADSNGKELPFTSERALAAWRLDYMFYPARDAVLGELTMEHAAQKNS